MRETSKDKDAPYMLSTFNNITEIRAGRFCYGADFGYIIVSAVLQPHSS